MPGLIWTLLALGLVAASAALFARARAHAGAARSIAADLETLDRPAPPAGADAQEPLLLTEVVDAPLRRLFLPDAIRRPKPLHLAMAAAFLSPAAALALSGPTPAAMMWLATAATIAFLILAERLDWRPASWLGVAAASLWGAIALATQRPEADNVWFAALLAACGAAGVIHMRRHLLAGLALFAAMSAMLGLACLMLGAASAYGACLAALIGAAALSGAIYRTLEPALALSWLVACLGLYALSGQSTAPVWLTPAAVLAAALYLAIEAFTLPVRGREAIVPATTGAVAAPFAVGVLLGQSVGMESFAASAFILAAATQSAVLAYGARRLGGVGAFGLAIAPPALSIATCLVLALTTLLGVLWAAAPLAACAIAFAAVNTRAPSPAWSVGALIVAGAASVCAFDVTLLLLIGARGTDAAILIAAGLAAPAILIGLAALVFAPRAPWTAAFLEAAALAIGIVALFMALRWIAAAQTPGMMFMGFAEAGAHVALWCGAALLLFQSEERGAFYVRRFFAALLCALAGLGAIAALGAVMNPWWGVWPTAAQGLPLLNTLAIGYAAPAALIGALAWRAHRRRWTRSYVIALAFAGLLGGLWAVLEARRAFSGPDLSPRGLVDAANLTLSLMALAAAIGLRAARTRLDISERTLAAALCAAILVKLALVDLAAAPGALRTASIAILALAGCALALPRTELKAPEPASP